MRMRRNQFMTYFGNFAFDRTANHNEIEVKKKKKIVKLNKSYEKFNLNAILFR